MSAPDKSRRTQKVSRLPALARPLDAEAAACFDTMDAQGNPVLNLHIATAHAPKLLKAKSPLAMALRSECLSSRAHRELAIVRVGHLMECSYEIDHHAPILRQCGFTDAQTRAVAEWRAHESLFDDRCRAVLGFVDAMVGDKGHVSDAAYNELSKNFTPQEIVEIAYNAAVYVANALVLNALRIELNTPDVRTTPGKF